MKTVAVIGASRHRHKFGNKAVRAFLRRGYNVLPINPKEREIEGLQVYKSVLDVPRDIDIATVYVPSDIGEKIITEIVTKGIPELWLNPGADGDLVIQRAKILGKEPVLGCSIIAIGESPDDYG